MSRSKKINQNRSCAMIILPVQCKMARAAVGLGIRELAAAAKVSMDTVARFERGEELKERTIEALQLALEAAGVEFTNGEQPGVRLTKAAAAPFIKRHIARQSQQIRPRHSRAIKRRR
jgi:transcriptional regulator with XRE-family HTH domain